MDDEPPRIRIGFDNLTLIMKLAVVLGCGAGGFFLLWLILSILVGFLWT